MAIKGFNEEHWNDSLCGYHSILAGYIDSTRAPFY